MTFDFCSILIMQINPKMKGNPSKAVFLFVSLRSVCSFFVGEGLKEKYCIILCVCVCIITPMFSCACCSGKISFFSFPLCLLRQRLSQGKSLPPSVLPSFLSTYLLTLTFTCWHMQSLKIAREGLS